MAKAEEYIKGDQFLFANKVVEVIEVAPTKFIMKFERQFDFKAGHVVAISIDKTHDPRIYSLCSGENDSEMQILFDLKSEGLLTPRLAGSIAGKRIYVSKPYGSFLPEKEQPMWWIATGTGIAPFYSMMKSGYKAQMLLHGAHEASNFYFEREFKQVFKEKYLRCNSGTDGVGDYFGRVTRWLNEQQELPKNNKYYLCGRAMMIVEVRDLLISKGIPFSNIISEIFF